MADESSPGLPLEAAANGDLAAFEQIVAAYERQVYATSFRLLGTREDAQDAAQEVFIRLYRNLHRIKAGAALSAWIYRVTVNVCRDEWRKRPALGPLEDEHAADEPDPHTVFDFAQRRALLQNGLKRLTERERTVLVLRDLEGLPTQEVAKALGSAEVTVRKHLCEARAKLRKYMESLKGRRP